MTSTRGKILLGLGLAVLVLIVAVLAVFREFPYAQAVALFESRVERTSGLRLNIGDVRPGWPFALRLSHVDVGLAVGDRTAWLAQAEPVRVRLKPLRLLAGDLAGTWTADLWRGRLEGRFEYGLWGNREICLSFDDAALPGFLLDNLPDIGAIEGPLKGKMRLCGSIQRFPETGNCTLDIGPGRLAGRLLPGLPKVTTSYDSLKITATLTGDQLSIEKLEFESPSFQVTAAGRIFRLEPPRIQLTGRLHLGTAGQAGPTQTFTLAGPLDNPRITMNPAGLTVPRRSRPGNPEQ